MNSASSPPVFSDTCSPGDAIAGLGLMHELSLTIDVGGRILWMSEVLGEYFGGSHTQVGKDWTELLEFDETRPRSTAHRELLGGIGESMQVAIAAANGAMAKYEIRALPLKDGSALALVLRPLVDHASSSGGALAAVLDALPDAVLAISPSGHVFFANAEADRLFGEPASTLIDCPIAQLLGMDEQLAATASCLASPDSTKSHALALTTSTGREVNVSLRVRAMPCTRGGSCLVLTLSPQSPLEIERTRLKHKVAELESYVHSVSHDLRSPLVSLLGFTRLLQQDYEASLDETGKHFLHRIEQAGHSMDALISDLLEISKIGRPGESRELVDPRSVLLQLHAELKPRLEEHGVALHIPADPPLVLCNRTRLYQVFSNLIGNALTHMGPCEDPEITVEIDSDAGTDHISVRDNGCGIATEAQLRIFEMFQTLRNRSDGGSTGIGLAIVKKIAETHDGNAWVESEPGRGACFHVTLAR